MKPIIEAKNINFIYNEGKSNEFHALKNVSFKIFPREFVIVFGPSGCGKSTILNVIAGLEIPKNGELRVMDYDLMNISKKEFAHYHRRELGMIYQAYNLITSLTVLDNVALPQIFVNVRKRHRNRWAKELLKRFGILQHADKIPTELSGGQQQRIGIARAIVNNPKIILADEPVGNLDSASAENVLEILADLNEKEEKTIVLVTHNPEYLNYGDRIIYMKDGIITHEVVNKDKRKKNKIKKEKDEIVIKAKSPMIELRELMRAYHGLSKSQINILIMPYKSKIFANHFISSRNTEETTIFEQAIQRRLMGSISEEDFKVILHKPSNQGGVGFSKQTVEKISQKVNRTLKMAYYIYQNKRQGKNENGEHDDLPLEEKIDNIAKYLLKTSYKKYYKNLSPEQLNRFKEAILKRLKHVFQKYDFFKELDKPFKNGGVGLNAKTARAISEELELLLILGFGVVKTVQTHRSDYLKEKEKKKDGESESKTQKQGDDLMEKLKKDKMSLQDLMILTQHREKEMKKNNKN